jgi:hypothetical protein
LLLGLRRGLWRTTDGGKSWEQLGGDTLNKWSFRGVAAYKESIVGCSDSFGTLFRQAGGVFLSTDNGRVRDSPSPSPGPPRPTSIQCEHPSFKSLG